MKEALKERIEYKEFYNDAINKEVQLKTHFTIFLKEKLLAQQENRPINRQVAFSLCFYPWILDANAKSELLKLAS